jgi:carboxyl-terminal processing protease
MKRILPILIPLSLLVVVFLHGKTQDTQIKATYQQGDLQPTETQKKVERLVFGILSNYHYRKIPVTDSLSSKIFDAYIKNLDPNKVFFLAADVAEMEKYRLTIDEQLNMGDLTSAFQMYNRYQKRMLERLHPIRRLFHLPWVYHPQPQTQLLFQHQIELIPLIAPPFSNCLEIGLRSI